MARKYYVVDPTGDMKSLAGGEFCGRIISVQKTEEEALREGEGSSVFPSEVENSYTTYEEGGYLFMRTVGFSSIRNPYGRPRICSDGHENSAGGCCCPRHGNTCGLHPEYS